MNVLLFGATGQQHQKLKEVVASDLMDLSPYASQLTGFDACFFCLGVSALGMKEDQYSRVTYDLTISVARTLARLNPNITFIYVSGRGTDSTERGRVIRSRTGWYNAMYAIAQPLFPVLKKVFPDSVTTTEQLGKAMIAVARSGSSVRVLETPDINKL